VARVGQHLSRVTAPLSLSFMSQEYDAREGGFPPCSRRRWPKVLALANVSPDFILCASSRESRVGCQARGRLVEPVIPLPLSARCRMVTPVQQEGMSPFRSIPALVTELLEVPTIFFCWAIGSAWICTNNCKYRTLSPTFLLTSGLLNNRYYPFLWCSLVFLICCERAYHCYSSPRSPLRSLT
jgi:hypothetical protein